MKTKPLTVPQVLALLRVAEHDYQAAYVSAARQYENEPFPYFKEYRDLAHAVWMEIGRCIGDIDGVRLTPVNTSARSAMIRRGAIRENLYGRDRHGGVLRFELTDTGQGWAEEAAAVSILGKAAEHVS